MKNMIFKHDDYEQTIVKEENTLLVTNGCHNKVILDAKDSSVVANGCGASLLSNATNCALAVEGDDSNIIIDSNSCTGFLRSSSSNLVSCAKKTKVWSSGDYNRVTINGNGFCVNILGSGNRVATCGDNGFVNITGEKATLSIIGNNVSFKAIDFTNISISERNSCGIHTYIMGLDFQKDADGDIVNAETIYMLRDGNLRKAFPTNDGVVVSYEIHEKEHDYIVKGYIKDIPCYSLKNKGKSILMGTEQDIVDLYNEVYGANEKSL